MLWGIGRTYESDEAGSGRENSRKEACRGCVGLASVAMAVASAPVVMTCSATMAPTATSAMISKFQRVE